MTRLTRSLSDAEGTKVHRKSIIALSVAVIVSAIVFLALITHFFFGLDIWLVSIKNFDSAQYWGQLGDFFGGMLNPVLSFAAFYMLIQTYNKQVSDGEKSDSDSKRVLNNHRFFEFTSLLHDTARGVEIDDAGKTYHNHRALGRAWNIFFRDHKIAEFTPDQQLRQALKTSYTNWRERFWPSVSSYVSSVIFIIENYISTSPASSIPANRNIDSDYFLEALRSQLSVSEKDMVFMELLLFKNKHELVVDLNNRGFWSDGGTLLDRYRGLLIDQYVPDAGRSAG